MPFSKGQNRYSLSWDGVDIESMASTMVKNCDNIAMFKDMFLPGGLDNMDYNDIMSHKFMLTVQSILMGKITFLVVLHEYAPTMRPTKTDILKVFD